nr:unnamed protein product [Callosobruchus chinensis]
MMYTNQDFNRVFKDLSETKRFGKPMTFDTEVKYCRLVSTGFLFYTFLLCCWQLYTPAAQVRSDEKNMNEHDCAFYDYLPF